MKPLFFLLTLTFSLCSCEKVAVDCEALSMATFRGIPQSAKEFKDSCQNTPVHYTKELCQKALLDLVYFKSLAKVKEIHGEAVEGCFTQNDLLKFSGSEQF